MSSSKWDAGLPEMPTEALVMWLKSSNFDVDKPCQDGEKLFEWLDESGNEKHCRQPDTDVQPCFKHNQIGQHPAVTFGGKQKFKTEGAVPVSGDRTFVHVYKFDNAPGNLSTVLGVGGAPCVSYKTAGGALALVIQNGDETVVTKPVFSATGPAIVSVVSSGSTITVRNNGKAVPLATTTKDELLDGASNFDTPLSSGAFSGDLSAASVMVGGVEGSDDNNFAGSMGEFTLYSRALGAGELEAVEVRTGEKYKIPVEASKAQSQKENTPKKSPKKKVLMRTSTAPVKSKLPPMRSQSTGKIQSQRTPTHTVGPGPPVHRGLITSYSAPRLTPMAQYPYNPKALGDRFTGRPEVNFSMIFPKQSQRPSEATILNVPGSGAYNVTPKMGKEERSFGKANRFYKPIKHTSLSTPGVNIGYAGSFMPVNARIQINSGCSFGRSSRFGDSKKLKTPSSAKYTPKYNRQLPRSAVTAIGRDRRFQDGVAGDPSTGVAPGPNYGPKSFDYPGDARRNPNVTHAFFKQTQNRSDATNNMRGPDLTPRSYKIRGGAMGRSTRFADPVRFVFGP